jgi:hypothetical protein
MYHIGRFPASWLTLFGTIARYTVPDVIVAHISVSGNVCEKLPRRPWHSPWCARPNYFLPVRVLSRLFRRLFLEQLVAAHQAGRLRFFGQHAALAAAQQLERSITLDAFTCRGLALSNPHDRSTNRA